jgi:Ner family transcriptional regulator
MTTPASPKKPAPKDWHAADIIAALRKAGWSMQQLGFAHGYKARTALTNALRNRYPRAERIIADALGLLPGDIWPTRYQADKVTSNALGGAQPRRPVSQPLLTAKASTRHAGRQPQTAATESTPVPSIQQRGR